jgi:hypothetical protein
MRTHALLAALTVTLALAPAAPAVAGQEQATRIVWTQVLDDEFTTARIVSARPAGSAQIHIVGSGGCRSPASTGRSRTTAPASPPAAGT